MNAGTQTGSLVNHIYSRMTKGEPEPTVGMGVTMLSWTDRDAGTIVEVNVKKRYIAVTEDDKKRVDNNGISESQQYEYTPAVDSHPYYYRKDKKGQWRRCYHNENGRLVFSIGGLILGRRESYYDFSF
tara:strand:- start:11805 stop:12188 length:384 start_codon:yes stop_codon:yes gene_type:complete